MSCGALILLGALMPMGAISQTNGQDAQVCTNLQVGLKNPSVVRFLDLRNQGLTDIPPEIGLFTNLVSLNLAGNLLEVLPPEIGQLGQLQELILVGNSIRSLPSEVGGLRSLRYVMLFNNPMPLSEVETLRHRLPSSARIAFHKKRDHDREEHREADAVRGNRRMLVGIAYVGASLLLWVFPAICLGVIARKLGRSGVLFGFLFLVPLANLIALSVLAFRAGVVRPADHCHEGDGVGRGASSTAVPPAPPP